MAISGAVPRPRRRRPVRVARLVDGGLQRPGWFYEGRLEAARPGRQRDHGRQRRRAAAAADGPLHPALSPTARAGRRPATGDEWVVVTAWLHEPGHAPARGSRSPSSRCWLYLGTTVATMHRARREHLPCSPGPPRSRVRLGGHLRRPRVVRCRPHRPRPRPRLAAHHGRPRRPRYPRRPSASAPPCLLVPPARGIVLTKWSVEG